MDPAPAIAARIEARMAEIGAGFSRSVPWRDAGVWHVARQDLSGKRVEIETTVKDAAALPWELLRDPDTDVTLRLRARAFVRAIHNAVQRPQATPERRWADTRAGGDLARRAGARMCHSAPLHGG